MNGFRMSWFCRMQFGMSRFGLGFGFCLCLVMRLARGLVIVAGHQIG